jgi:predicted DsbA family dithiol-disulfide isomerase
MDDLSRKYGHDVRVSQGQMFDAAGLPNTTRDFVPNSRKALNLAELARDRGRLEQLHPRLMSAYWAEGRDIGDEEVLLDEAALVGLDVDEARDAIATLRYQERIEQSTASVLEMGAGGVPAWVVDDRLLIPGAQPHELFERVMHKLGYEGEPGDNVP